jgi:hypothetical protein
MIEAISVFLIGLGAVLVSLASTLRMAWLAVLVPVLIAAGAAVWLFRLSRHGRRARHTNRITHANRPDRRMAA